MKLGVLGGTVFLSRAVVVEAVRRGHDVVCVCRGVSGEVPTGASHVVWDRNEPVPASLSDGLDAVVDVAGQPSHVRRAVDTVPDAHWVYVSSVSAYADVATPGGPDSLPLHEPRHDDGDLAVEPEAFGPLKVACEQAVAAGARSSIILRPGLIVGPDDPTGRFTYWAVRLAEGGEILAPGSPTDAVQVIDVRDLAAWIVSLAEQRSTGVLDAIGPPRAFEELLRAGEPDARLTWVPDDVLIEHGVQPWAGPSALPLWLPRPEYDGMLNHSATPALEQGLVLRPLAETFADTLNWARADPAATAVGLARARETQVLAAWRDRPSRS